MQRTELHRPSHHPDVELALAARRPRSLFVAPFPIARGRTLGPSLGAVALALVLAAVGSSPSGAQTSISAEGVVESRAGGFKFPDGSVQDTAAAPIGTCPTLDPSDEMIWIGGVCVDTYEASIWDAPVGGNQIIGEAASDYCSADGQDCDSIWARSVAGVEPARHITWFQAQAALANSGKRLPTNAEWQVAVRGTPDGNNCNVLTGAVSTSGIFGLCVSGFGVYDMVGNLWEWIAEWVSNTTACPGWGAFSDDTMCLAGSSASTQSPDALLRGGDFVTGTGAGPFAITATAPSISGSTIGFRGVR